mgnify:CR=1 FL=1|tara:strand:+ start:286576 stop:287865 length:1290 start_codon:yes stop_codon:yes gene_type:complete
MNTASVQIAIVGGGIAGLWTLNRLSEAGYNAVLLEKSALGDGQTLASQGIIHGGLKYALNGTLSPASSAIAGMPARWRACLDGSGETDLRSVRVLSPHYYMWSGGSVRSRLKTFLGSKALRGRIDALTAHEYPAFFSAARSLSASSVPTSSVPANSVSRGGLAGGTLYQLTDFVIDTPSLLRTLASRWQDRIFQSPQIQLSEHGMTLTNNTTRIALHADRVILCAGAGNEALLAGQQFSGLTSGPAMQRRPLHMVAVRVSHPAPPYVHCIGDSFGMTPRLTITAHPCRDEAAGEWIWYLGGELAESGVNVSAREQCRRAETELVSLFPWIDFAAARWHSFYIDRAEPEAPDMSRPDNAFVAENGKFLTCWPTKLTLCPNLGDTALRLVAASLAPAGNIHAGGSVSGSDTPLQNLLPTAGIADTPWESLR